MTIDSVKPKIIDEKRENESLMTAQLKNGSCYWQAPEYIQHDKHPRFFLILTTLSVLIGLYALYTNNILFLVFIAIATFLIFEWSGRKPLILNFALNNEGIMVHDRLYSFKQYLAFSSIEISDDTHEFILRPKDRFRSNLKFPVPKEVLDGARAILIENLEEVTHDEVLPETIARLIKF